MRSNTTADGSDETKIAACDGSGSYHEPTRQTQQRQQRQQRRRRSEEGDGFKTLLLAQAGTMALAGVVLFALGMLSAELYFVVSFLGLLALRIVLAPTDRVPTWWTRLNWVVRVGFVVFGYLILRRLPELLP